MNTMAMPRMTQAQAMVGMYRSMPKKARTEFAEWFFQNVEMDVTQSERCVDSAKDNEESFLETFKCAVKSAKDFKEGKVSYMSMEELMNEL